MTAAFLLALAPGSLGQDTVTQKDKFASATEGEPIQLTCSYTGSEYSLQWYKQYLGSPPKLMEILFRTGTKAGVRCQETVEQNPLELSRTEGQSASISCQYKTRTFYSLHWYRQSPGESPEFLLLLSGKEASKEPNVRAEHDRQKQTSNLHIGGVQLGDAATYFCAVEAQSGSRIGSLRKNLARPQRTAGVSGQDAVTQEDRFASAKEGEPFQLNCSYTGTLYSLQWYKQYLSGQVEHMGSLATTRTESHDRVRCQETVEQNPLELSRTEGQSATISCQYKTRTFCSLHWYRQSPGESPEFLLLLSGKEASKEPNVHAEHDRQKQTSILRIRGVQLRDAATYFCAVEAQSGSRIGSLRKNLARPQRTAGVSGQNSVAQEQQFASTAEGKPVQLHCSYTGVEYSLQWYKQHPSSQIEFMTLLTSTRTVSHDRFNMSLDTRGKTTSLLLRSPRLEDAVVYFCALETQCYKVLFHLSQNLLWSLPGQDSVTQKDQMASAKEGEPTQLTCSYTGNPNSLQWYKQQSQGGPVHFMASLFASKTESHGHFDISLDRTARNSSLFLKSPQLNDSAVYFCAMDHSATRLHPTHHKTQRPFQCIIQIAGIELGRVCQAKDYLFQAASLTEHGHEIDCTVSLQRFLQLGLLRDQIRQPR
ncbi:hypothetical protein lerEdw1_011626 [Lerista edwardsae]|nr:hypothetical protein lerEdw1_011626 [Lerista edwardsae]